MNKYVLVSLIIQFTFNAHATIISAKELFSHQLKQTVLLFGDNHWIATKVDTTQIAHVIKNLKQYKPLFLIEGASDFQQAKQSKKQTLFLPELSHEATRNSIENKNLEFRKFGADFRVFNMNLIQSNNYLTAKELFSKQETKHKLFNLFSSSLKECTAKQDELYRKLDSLFDTKPNHPLLVQAEKYFFDTVKKREQLMALLPAQKNNPQDEAVSVAQFIFNDFIMPSSSEQKIILNQESAMYKLEELSDNLFELGAFLEIIDNSAKSHVAIFTGQKHASALSKLLQKNLFIKKNSSPAPKKQINGVIEQLSQTKTFKEIVSSPELHKFALNIEQFFKNCSIKN